MSYKLLASIRFFALQDIDFIETPNFKITKNHSEKRKVIDEDFRKVAGLHIIQSFEKNAIAFSISENLEDKAEFINKKSTDFFETAQQIATFLQFLWLIKDNSVSLEKAFAQFTVVKKWNWWTDNNIFSTSNGLFEETSFNADEIKAAMNLLFHYTKNCIGENAVNAKGKHDNEVEDNSNKFRSAVNPDKQQNKIERAFGFLSTGRCSPHLPLKITHYMSILECLFSLDTNEVSHKVSERTAFYLGDTIESRLEIFKAVKAAYSIRSKFVHGDKIKTSHEDISATAIKIDDIIRHVLKKIITTDYTNFLHNDNNKMNDFFNQLIFGSELPEKL